MILYTVHQENTSAKSRGIGRCLFYLRSFQLDSLLQHPLPDILAIILPKSVILITFNNPLLPILPVEPPKLRPQHGNHSARNETNAHRPIRITVKRLLRILRITLQPDMIERHNLRRLHARFTSRNPITGETDNPLDGGVFRMSRRPSTTIPSAYSSSISGEAESETE